MDLISLYDKTYTDEPDKWVSNERNEFAYQTLHKYGIPRTLLDVGCGSGHTLHYLNWRLYRTQFTGIDLSGEAIRLAQRRMPNADFFQTDLESWEYKYQFEMILLMGVIQHLPDLKESLSKIQQLKSKLGVVYIETPNYYAFTGVEEDGDFIVDLDGIDPPEWHLTHPTWEAILVDSGFAILERKFGSSWYSEFVWVVQ